MEITYTYRVSREADGYNIECLENDEIFTCCFRPEDIQPMAREVSEMVLATYREEGFRVAVPAPRVPGPEEFQLTFDLTTGKCVDPTLVRL